MIAPPLPPAGSLDDIHQRRGGTPAEHTMDDTNRSPDPGAVHTRQTRRGFARAALAASLAAAAAPSGSLAAPRARSAVARQATSAVEIVSGALSGTHVRVAADISAVLEPAGLRVLPVVSKGSGQNIDNLINVRGVDAALVQADVLAAVRRQDPAQATMAERAISYVARLYDEEVHVLARPEIHGLEDLAGKRVNVDQEGGGTALTASVVLGALGIPVQAMHDNQEIALQKLRAGQLEALLYVAGKPVHLFDGIAEAEAGGMHFLLPLNPALLAAYVPGQLDHADYPSLIAPGSSVGTIAVGTVLAVYNWPTGSERYAALGRLVEATFDRLDELRRPPHHPKWHDTRLVAQVPGWPRFAPAQAWLQRHVAGRAQPAAEVAR